MHTCVVLSDQRDDISFLGLQTIIGHCDKPYASAVVGGTLSEGEEEREEMKEQAFHSFHKKISQSH